MNPSLGQRIALFESSGGSIGFRQKKDRHEEGAGAENVSKQSDSRKAGWQNAVRKLAKERYASHTSSTVRIEDDRGLWFVTWRKPRSRPRFLPSQIALYEAQRADQRGDVELAVRLRWAATEAQSRNAPDRH